MRQPQRRGGGAPHGCATAPTPSWHPAGVGRPAGRSSSGARRPTQTGGGAAKNGQRRSPRRRPTCLTGCTHGRGGRGIGGHQGGWGGREADERGRRVGDAHGAGVARRARAWKRGEREARPESVAAGRLRWYPGGTTPCKVFPLLPRCDGAMCWRWGLRRGVWCCGGEMPAPPPQKRAAWGASRGGPQRPAVKAQSHRWEVGPRSDNSLPSPIGNYSDIQFNHRAVNRA